jgi:DNA-binding phage protein
MPKTKSYHSYLMESLRDPLEASAYIDAVMEEGDPKYIMIALRNVVEAQRQDKFSSEAHWEYTDRILAQSELPNLVDFARLLKSLGLRLSVVSQVEQIVA